MKTNILLLALIVCFVMIFAFERFPLESGETIYVIPAITDTKILPTSPISSSYISNKISITASPGEYETASFVIRSQQNISSIMIQPTDMVGITGFIPSSNVDIRVVKTWYQGGYDLSVESYGRYLTPELLLKDDSLIKVDGTSWDDPGGNNYLKLTSGEYVLMSQSNDTNYGPAIIPITDRPFSDSSTLQPVNIHGGMNKQLWITVKVPDDARAGIYNAEIWLTTGFRLIGRLQLKLQVLPFQLAQPYLTYSIYYRGMLDANGSISSESKNTTQFTAEMNDLYQHGVTNPNVYGAGSQALLGNMLDIRNAAGMSGQPLYFLDDPLNYFLTDAEFKSFCYSHGVTDIYLYAVDEGSLAANTTDINNIHARGYKAFVALHNSTTASSLASTLDLLIWSGTPSPGLISAYHSYGHQVFSYANPQVVPEYPGTFRLNYGLLLWQKDYDGAMDYAYQHSYGDIWNDFDSNTRDHVFAYPTANGVIDTVQWEGFREGVDDVRYLTTLLNTIQTAKAAGKDTSAAEIWLANLKASNLATQDLDAIRSQMIFYILNLGKFN